jgi:4'-phosphopantetheinyl transferase EntD
VVGSITHTSGICAAVVAPSERFLGLGVDVEVADRVKAELRARICTVPELRWLESLPQSRRAAGATLIFAAKEAFYKAQFPLARERLGFQAVDVELTNGGGGTDWNGAQGQFLVHGRIPLGIAEWTDLPLAGSYRFFGEFVAAGIAIAV